MATKMKGLLKGLRYISQIFDDEKEPEMQIGFPTDVKHVAHIGWDGPVTNSPSWLENFKLEGQDNMSGPPATDDSSLRGSSSIHGSSPARDFPDIPKSTRRCSANGDIFSTDSSKGDKSEKVNKSRHSRKCHSGSEVSDISNSRSSSRNQLLPDLASGSESPSHNIPVPDIPKKTRRKKSKDSSQGSKSSSRTAKAIAEASSYSSTFSDTDVYSCPSPNTHSFQETGDRKISGLS